MMGLKYPKGYPECGVDFCEVCGDCIACYGGDPCYTGGDVEDRSHCEPSPDDVHRDRAVRGERESGEGS